MSLYNTKTLTAQYYDNPTNSNPPPFTSTGGDSDAVFRGPNAAPLPPNTMKGGYTYKRNAKKKSIRSVKRYSGKSSSISSELGMNTIPTLQKMGGSRKKRRRTYKKHSRTIGMMLGRTGGASRKRRHKKGRHLRGGVSPFPDGYSLGGPLNPMLSALANPPVYQPYSH
jgi:hypothetical protein